MQKLNPRECVMVLGGGGVLVMLGLWLYVWQPLMVEREAQSARIAGYLSTLQIARAAASGAPVIAPVAASTTPIGPRVTQSAEEAGIPLARLDPDGERLRITVAKAGFAEVTSWIASLEASSGVRAVAVEMDRLTEPGQISLRLTLEDVQ
ncbi:type II secretion system protein GspM [Sulfitobacter guttiformis]|nr:type II secretion system protein GspM [Sulfitobacter guttiformis]